MSANIFRLSASAKLALTNVEIRDYSTLIFAKTLAFCETECIGADFVVWTRE